MSWREPQRELFYQVLYQGLCASLAEVVFAPSCLAGTQTWVYNRGLDPWGNVGVGWGVR